MLKDPLEFYTYPKEWYSGRNGIKEKISSGLYILTPDGWLRRGITTATTASAAINAAISSLHERTREVEVLTPAGIKVKVRVESEDGVASAKKFAGDHAFDVTDGLVIRARVCDGGIRFGKGIGVCGGKKAVSRNAIRQIMENFRVYAEKYDYKGGVIVEIPEGEIIAQRTRNVLLGITGGVSILGSTGFVEPWCEKLLSTKIDIACQYQKIAVATGRSGWRYALENYPEFQPFVFGVYVGEILRRHGGDVLVVGKPGLLFRWAGKRSRKSVLKKARKINKGVVDVVLIEDSHEG
jgi:cobalt-precorrin-5B (C1)-methyltransferase